jgi:hypothetical protein
MMKGLNCTGWILRDGGIERVLLRMGLRELAGETDCTVLATKGKTLYWLDCTYHAGKYTVDDE